MHLERKKVWGAWWDSRYQFRIYLFLIYFFQGKKLKKNYNRLFVRIEFNFFKV